MRCIAIDWGSTRLRAYLIDNKGNLHDKLESENGALLLKPDEFEPTLKNLCDDWLTAWPEIPIYMSGMVGKRNGWLEAPYLNCPLNLNTVYENLIPVPSSLNRQVLLTPGLICQGPNGTPDVIRGEEQLIIGALSILGKANNLHLDTNKEFRENTLICLPGTHSKWANINGFSIEQFATFFSGEIFKLLSSSSSLINNDTKPTNYDESAFVRGVEQSKLKGSILHQVFSVRTLALTKNISNNYARNYLSGLIIGNEIKEASGIYVDLNQIILIGASHLNQYYQTAISRYNLKSQCIDSETAFIKGSNTLYMHISNKEPELC